MGTVRVITDSSSSISKEEALQLGVDVVPMPVIIDGVEYKDGVDLFYDDAVKHLEQNHIFKTSQPLPADLIEIWEHALKEYDQVVYIPISSGISGSCVNAFTLAQNYEGRVVVVDNKSVECLLKLNVKEAVEMAKEGYSAEEIRDILEADFKDNFCCIIPESLETLKRGGRITPAAAAVAGLLKINPIIAFNLGNLDLFDKVRTFKKAVKVAMDAAIKTDENPDEYYWCCIGCGYSKEEEQEFINEFKEASGRSDIQYFRFSPIVMGHTGNRTIGFGRVKKHTITKK